MSERNEGKRKEITSHRTDEPEWVARKKHDLVFLPIVRHDLQVLNEFAIDYDELFITQHVMKELAILILRARIGLKVVECFFNQVNNSGQLVRWHI